MCFSAQASFTSGAVLTTIGVGTFRQAGKSDRKLFAAIPSYLVCSSLLKESFGSL